jgi:predicted membrane channel-forming protein YqfA (hemolysin III family)
LLTLHPAFLGPTFRKYRALMYTCFGLSAILFISHSIVLYGFTMQKRRLSIEWMALMGFLNIAGAAIYASRGSIFLEMLFLASVWLTDNRYRSAGFQLVLTS